MTYHFVLRFTFNFRRKIPTSLTSDEYYGPLIDSYTKSILKSGLLLDEDLEALLSISQFRTFSEKTSYKPSLSLLASIIALFSSSLLAKKLNTPLLAAPALVATASLALLEFKNQRNKQENKEVVDRLLGILSKIQKLNVNVMRYMKTRRDVEKTKNESPLPFYYNKNVEEFMQAFSKNSSHVIEFLVHNLRSLSVYSAELQEDFKMLQELEFCDIFSDTDLGDTEKCLSFIQKTHDVNVLLFSKLLSYLGVVLNSKNMRESDMKTIINQTLPKTVKTLQHYSSVTKKHFVAFRQSAKSKSEMKQQSEGSKRKNISNKLEATLISSVNNLSLILEKSQCVLERLETSENDTNLPEIGNAILDLRNHTFATYESLDLLCRLYGILSNSNLNQPPGNKIENRPKTSPTSETLPKICYDDDTLPIEENFELYIDKDEFEEIQQPSKHEEESNAYLSLMLQELKQSLKQHERFIAAKNKRGSVEEEEIRLERKKCKGESPPRFNLKALEDHLEEGVSRRVDMPAPPPPPLPAFNLGDLERESGQANARSMLENIRTLSSQRDVREEVFGNSDEDSDGC
ncbi:hypothetical protein NQ315_011961 [Exocentrus adspersus]|uniref:Vezatin n=1 Tax=Exocentrus adspersus TaxID=1586481 RepID=A0AAV8W2L9_9CUCU|nr:hypothetical protein NQ315_011961 [Exocentrus adspersus]